ncbi:MAG: DUF4412 domain-containing protein [Nitrospinae bacterium]|nr:DUF4412 domain-containing protein [Nitrospinota bacterium]
MVCYQIAVWMVGLWFPVAACAGWVLEQIEYANPGAERTRTVQYISKNRLKTVGAGNTFIMDLHQNGFTASDQENRVYWSGTVHEYIQEVQTFQQTASDLARQQMEEALKDLPPDQRRAMEEVIKQREGPGVPPPAQQPAKRPQVTVERTQETTLIAGYKATKAMVYADGKPYQEVWLANGIDLKGDLDLKRMRGLQAKLSKAIMPESPGGQAVEEDPAYEKMLDEGYPVKIVELGERGEPESVTEVVRVEQRDIPDKEFQPPEGYRRIDLRAFFREELEKMKRGE